MTSAVEVRDVTRQFGETLALDGVSLSLEPGEFAVLLGPSGCGKTTLLNILGGFLSPDRGSVLIGGRDVTAIPPARRPTTTMFQDYALFPHMTLADNVAFGLRMRGLGRRERASRADEMLDLVGLGTEGRRMPHALSGGQRQRVALARALAVKPAVLLLDEPLGALDLKLRQAMQDELKAIQREVGTTFVHVTHDQEEAMAIADRIVVINAGRIEDQGPPERVYLNPATCFTAGFMGKINLIYGRSLGRGRIETPLGMLEAKAFGGIAEGRAVTLGLRPEHLGRAGAMAIGEAVIRDEAFYGTHHRVHVMPDRAPDMVLVAHLRQGDDAQPGTRLTLFLDAASIIILER